MKTRYDDLSEKEQKAIASVTAAFALGCFVIGFVAASFVAAFIVAVLT